MGKFKFITPPEKSNWHRLSESQKRYAWEQYNLALVRRGIEIDHPIPGRGNQPVEKPGQSNTASDGKGGSSPTKDNRPEGQSYGSAEENNLEKCVHKIQRNIG